MTNISVILENCIILRKKNRGGKRLIIGRFDKTEKKKREKKRKDTGTGCELPIFMEFLYFCKISLSRYKEDL